MWKGIKDIGVLPQLTFISAGNGSELSCIGAFGVNITVFMFPIKLLLLLASRVALIGISAASTSYWVMNTQGSSCAKLIKNNVPVVCAEAFIWGWWYCLKSHLFYRVISEEDKDTLLPTWSALLIYSRSRMRCVLFYSIKKAGCAAVYKVQCTVMKLWPFKWALCSIHSVWLHRRGKGGSEGLRFF